MRLNLGSGRRPMAGFVNVDCVPLPGVDVVAEFDDSDKVTLPFPDDSCEAFALIHVLEHIRHPLPLMQELHRIAEPDATCEIQCPYGSSDDAWEDPTHVRPIFVQSFIYFGQPAYWRADYGFRGDWHVDDVALHVDQGYSDVPPDELYRVVMGARNVVNQIDAVLRAVKPAREPVREDRPTPVRFVFDGG